MCANGRYTARRRPRTALVTGAGPVGLLAADSPKFEV